ncbi:MAG: IS1 family transposase [Proteobacteria bacterium]|nr:IS1 family transposase [Pseudomonadota bacterium]
MVEKMSEKIACKNCQSTSYWKNGMKKDKQRYKCKDCGYQFTNTPPRGKPEKLKEIAVTLYVYCGISMLKIGKMCGVSDVSVLNWIKKAGEKAPPLNPKSDSGIVILDEMWHFENGKSNKIWLWRAIDGKTRRPLAWELGDRSLETVKKLVAKVDDGKCDFVTDEYPGFFAILPEDRHYYGKDLTFPIEQSNSDIRHWLSRFIRRSKSTTRSVSVLAACISLMHAVQETGIFHNILSFLT